MPTPNQQLDAFIKKFDPAIAKQAKAILKKMRQLLPGAVELVYDNYNALAIGFGPNEKAGKALFSIALYPKWISLFFFFASKLRDTNKLMQGKGTLYRHIVLDTPDMLNDPGVLDLIEQSLEVADPGIDPTQPRQLIIKSISAKQRPRRSEAK